MNPADDMAVAATNCRREIFRNICSLHAEPVCCLFFVSCASIGPTLKRGRKPIVICSTRSGQNDRSENYIVRLWDLRQPRIIAECNAQTFISARDIIRQPDCPNASSLFHPVYFQNPNAQVLCSYHLTSSYYLNGVLPLLARNGHGGALTPCPFVRGERKTYPRNEDFFLLHP